MTARRKILVLMTALLLQSVILKAQTDSLAFDQGRLRIWCETARFVYDDNQADSLLPSINCQSWEALQSSLRATEPNLGVIRLMNSVDKPSIYSGYTGTESKLQKLVSEITDRLKRSPARAKDPARLDRVDSLGGQLLLVARKASLQDEAGGATAGGSPALVEEEADDDELMQPPGELIPVEPNNNLPWNEILQWLTLLVLGGFLFWKLRDLEHRYSRLKREFRELQSQVNGFVISNIHPGPMPEPTESLSEKEVREVVKEELRQNQPVAKPAVVAPKPQAPVVPLPVEESAAPHQSEHVAAPATAQEEDNGIYYDKMPFRGGFHQNEMSRERQRDSLYTIRVFQSRPEEAEYWISEDPEVQRYAMQNGFSFFEEGCEFTEVEENPSRVVNEQKGRLRKEGGVWKILQKALVRFE